MPPRPTLAGRRVLLADDVASIRHIYGTALTRAGAEVVSVVDGLDAVAAHREADAARRPFHAVVLDYAMPRMDGFAVAETLRADEFPGAIVGVSAELPPSDLRRWVSAGCDEVFAKGVSLRELVDAVADAIDRRRP